MNQDFIKAFKARKQNIIWLPHTYIQRDQTFNDWRLFEFIVTIVVEELFKLYVMSVQKILTSCGPFRYFSHQ
jgi:hypothetical protein